jgi:hypothetical protein
VKSQEELDDMSFIELVAGFVQACDDFIERRDDETTKTNC